MLNLEQAISDCRHELSAGGIALSEVLDELESATAMRFKFQVMNGSVQRDAKHGPQDAGAPLFSQAM